VVLLMIFVELMVLGGSKSQGMLQKTTPKLEFVSAEK
jgi:hypothetical protein